MGISLSNFPNEGRGCSDEFSLGIGRADNYKRVVPKESEPIIRNMNKRSTQIN